MTKQTRDKDMNDSSKKIAAIFLDRDGTINEEVGYLDSLDKLKLYDNTAEAVRLINESGMKAVVITNQSGIARGYFDEKFVETAHNRIQSLLRQQGAFIDAFYYCPHHPSEGIGKYLQSCSCRKPEPGLLITASQELNIDLNHSYTVGDMLKDIQVAARVGAKGVLVKSGYGMNTLARDIGRKPGKSLTGEENAKATPGSLYPHYIAEDILEAVRWIIKDGKR